MRIEIETLACQRGGRTVFRDVDFSVPAGTAALLRGPNGVGKSTLLRVLAGLIPASAGRCLLDGAPASPSDLQEHVAYSGHLDAVKPALTVRQNLDVWAGIFGADVDVDTALAFFGLDELFDRPVAQCSAGQKRRLGLARLLVTDRPVWLLDEPTVSLDHASAQLVADMINRHCQAGGSAMIATHIDLALPDGPVLEMVPPAPAEPGKGAVDTQDAFLDGQW